MKLHMTLASILLGFGCAASRPEYVEIPGGVLHTQDGAEQIIAPFYIERTEVTVSAYRACVAAGRCRGVRRNIHGTKSRCSTRRTEPVNCVTSGQARAYCAWRGGRLPTPLEWQWVAQGREEARMFPWGEEQPSCDVAILHGGEFDGGCGHGPVAPVGSRPAGATRDGVLDIVGNMSEFVVDQEGAVFGAGGTSWDTPGEWFRASSPQFTGLDRATITRGFRCMTSAPRGR